MKAFKKVRTLTPITGKNNELSKRLDEYLDNQVVVFLRINDPVNMKIYSEFDRVIELQLSKMPPDPPKKYVGYAQKLEKTFLMASDSRNDAVFASPFTMQNRLAGIGINLSVYGLTKSALLADDPKIAQHLISFFENNVQEIVYGLYFAFIRAGIYNQSFLSNDKLNKAVISQLFSLYLSLLSKSVILDPVQKSKFLFCLSCLVYKDFYNQSTHSAILKTKYLFKDRIKFEINDDLKEKLDNYNRIPQLGSILYDLEVLDRATALKLLPSFISTYKMIFYTNLHASIDRCIATLIITKYPHDIFATRNIRTDRKLIDSLEKMMMPYLDKVKFS